MRWFVNNEIFSLVRGVYETENIQMWRIINNFAADENGENIKANYYNTRESTIDIIGVPRWNRDTSWRSTLHESDSVLGLYYIIVFVFARGMINICLWLMSILLYVYIGYSQMFTPANQNPSRVWHARMCC